MDFIRSGGIEFFFIILIFFDMKNIFDGLHS